MWCSAYRPWWPCTIVAHMKRPTFSINNFDFDLNSLGQLWSSLWHCVSFIFALCPKMTHFYYPFHIVFLGNYSWLLAPETFLHRFIRQSFKDHLVIWVSDSYISLMAKRLLGDQLRTLIIGMCICVMILTIALMNIVYLSAFPISLISTTGSCCQRLLTNGQWWLKALMKKSCLSYPFACKLTLYTYSSVL